MCVFVCVCVCVRERVCVCNPYIRIYIILIFFALEKKKVSKYMDKGVRSWDDRVAHRLRKTAKEEREKEEREEIIAENTEANKAKNLKVKVGKYSVKVSHVSCEEEDGIHAI